MEVQWNPGVPSEWGVGGRESAEGGCLRESVAWRPGLRETE